MSDQLSKVFAALADPTRRDIVARLSVGDATVNALAAPYEVSLQAISKHLKVLEEAGLVTRSREAQRRPVHLEAEVFDLMTKWIERYQAPGRGALRSASTRCSPSSTSTATRCRSRTSTTSTTPGRTSTRKDRHHDHHAHPGHDRGRREGPDDPHLPRLRGHPGAAVPGAHRPRALRPVGRARPTSAPTSTTGTPATAARGATPPSRRRGVHHGLPRLLPHGEPGADRADLHLGGHARGRGARDAHLRGPRRRAHPPARDEPVRLASRPATSGWPAAWSPASTTATPRSTAMLEAGEL